MFCADCPACGVTVLLTADQIVALTLEASRWVVDALCWCGEPVSATLPRPVPRAPDEHLATGA
jgi:hypothetical protein